MNQYIGTCLDGPSSIFKSLNPRDREILVNGHSPKLYKKGASIFLEGEKPAGMICIVSGKAKVFKYGVGGREQILRMLKPGEFMGYSSLFSDHPWSVSARAIEDSATCIFEKTAIMRVLKKNPDLALSFVKILSEELSHSDNRTVSLTQKHVRGRVAESILMLKEIYGCEKDGRTIDVSLTREDIANLSNMTTSNAIRTLSDLAAEGSIELKGRRISILESSNLEQISSLG